MLDLLQNTLVFLATLAVAVLFMMILDRLWPGAKRSVHNNLIGWQLGTIGTIYAVILGFMLFTVWTSYGDAQRNVDLEANAVRDLYRLAEGLPQPQRSQLQGECRAYVDAVLNQDWPAMASNQIPEASHAVNQTMWKTLLSVRAPSTGEAIAEDHAISELSSLTEHRRTRLLETAYRLPAIFWVVLIVGACLVVFSSSLFGSDKSPVHMVQVLSCTTLITLTLLAIADVNRPFQGWIRVSTYALIRAQGNMTE